MSCFCGRSNSTCRTGWSSGSCGQTASAQNTESCWTASQIATLLASSENSGGCTCAKPGYVTVPAFLCGNTQSEDNPGCFQICFR